jgi:hypothetical protein
MNGFMRIPGFVVICLAACGTNDPGWSEARTFSFGPYDIQPSQEISDQCVQITLGNDEPIYINKIELVTGPGFHHSNWFWDPATTGNVIGPFDGPDGTFTCDDRSFDQAVAAFKGGVIFAQSTQAQQDVQEFPNDAAILIPPHAKLVSTIHLLNPSDQKLHLEPTITLTPIPEATVTTQLAGVSFENHALGLPPDKQSRFTLDCDLQPEWDVLHGTGGVTAPTPDFKLYYALAHYHAMGTGLSIEAVRPDDTATTIFSTDQRIGDALGSALDPLFDMTGYTRLRFSCDYYNNTSATVGWGIGTNEMCVFLAFSDSGYNWGGGVVDENAQPGDPVDVGGVMTYTHPCQVYATELSTH